jgi:hypothetical protein
MANEVSYAALLATGGRVARVLSNQVHALLYDPVGLRALMVQMPWAAAGSATTNFPAYTRGLVAVAAGTEVLSTFVNVPPVTTNYDITVARYGRILAPTDLLHFTGGAIDIPYTTGVLVETFDLTLTDLLCGMFATIATNVGTSGVDMSVDDFFDAIYALNLALNPADLACVLHPVQVNDLIEAVRAETGPMAFRSDAQGMLTAPGVGFRGQFAGVAIYQSDSCATANAGADRRGCMFSSQAFAYQLANVADRQGLVNPDDIAVATPEMFVEKVRDGINGITQYVVNFYPGVHEIEDLRATCIITDA